MTRCLPCGRRSTVQPATGSSPYAGALRAGLSYADATSGTGARSRMRDPGAEPRLVVPEGLVIDESARERLERAARARARRPSPGSRPRSPSSRRARATACTPSGRRSRRRGGRLAPRAARRRCAARCWCARRRVRRCATAGSRSPSGVGARRSRRARARSAPRRSARSQPRPSAAGRRSRAARWWCSSAVETPADADWLRPAREPAGAPRRRGAHRRARRRRRACT